MAEEKTELTKQEQIHAKGFGMNRTFETEFGSLKVGAKTLDDAVIDLATSISKVNSNVTNKANIIQAINDRDYKSMREISDFFYHTDGIYKRVCNYFATLYRYDWYCMPEVYDKNVKGDKLDTEFRKVLAYLDNSAIKKMCGEIALSVITKGVYYGYLTDSTDFISFQELPAAYCRCRFSVGNIPAIEFNMKFFDDQFPNEQYRLRILKLFPAEFGKGYHLYKTKKLLGDNLKSSTSWYMLDPEKTVKFTYAGADEMPLFISAIPTIIDLDNAQELDRRKQMQKLLKILVQKLPMDKNGELIFDVDEARDIHNNAVAMLRRAIGVDVLTTFADITPVNMTDRVASEAADELEKNERGVYNSFGVSQNLFNANGNLALANSILNDEGIARSLLLQFQVFFDKIVKSKGKNKKYKFRFYMLETTQYNYKELSKMYKDQVQIGYSKLLPQIALGHSQSFILNSLYFENEVLNLSELMVPPMMSSTMSGKDLDKKNKSGNKKAQDTTEGKVGRPEKEETEQSEKTLQNKESMS